MTQRQDQKDDGHKYKYHCDMKCLVGKCKIRDAGACYHICNMHDTLSILRQNIEKIEKEIEEYKE